ncbi:COG3650 family protein [Sphingobium chlorophenolicum]|nr:membrane-like protein [Sphingobium chlorophenolicum]
MAGCGGDKDVPAGNVAQLEASAPIVAQNEVANQAAGNVSEPVSRGTGAAGPMPSRAPGPIGEDDYRAIGTEPFWAVTVKGSTATLERPDKAPVRYAVSRQNDGRAIRYLGDGFSMTVTEGPCSDGMSDAVWSNRVAVAFGEGTLNGCGGLRDDQGGDGQ